MAFLSYLLMQLLAAYTVLVEPLLRTNFYRLLKKQLKVDTNARILFYRTQILWELSWMVVIIVIMIPIQHPLEWLGILLPSPIGWVILLALVLGVGLSIMLLRRNPRAMQNMQRSLEATSLLLPSTPRERKWFAAVAITAGICEEVLYRGFLLHYLAVTFAGLDWLFASIISGIVYGLSRVYLGRRAFFQTTLNGFSFAIIYYLSGNLLSIFSANPPTVLIGSLLPAMVFHALAELRTLAVIQEDGKKKKAR